MTAANIVTDDARIAAWKAPGSPSYQNWDNGGMPLYFLLVSQSGDAIADATKRSYNFESDFNVNEITGTGYTARGQAPGGQAVSQSVSVVTVTCSPDVWSNATLSAYGVWIVNHQASAAGSPALLYDTFGGSPVTSTNANFTVAINSNGLFQCTGG